MAIHYFIFGERIAAVEDPRQAAKYITAGWKPVERASFIAAWRRRDMAVYATLWGDLAWRRLSASSSRAIGALPHGFARHWV